MEAKTTTQQGNKPGHTMTIRSFEQHTPNIAHNAFVDETALVLGQVTLAEDVSIWPMAVLRGDIHHIHIGARTNIQDDSVLHVTHESPYSQPGGFPLLIGEDVTVGHNAILHACTIGNRCLIGMGATILDGAVIQDDVIVGANALVSPGKILESGYLYLGSPAKRARALTESEKASLLYSAAYYVELKDRHRPSDIRHRQ